MRAQTSRTDRDLELLRGRLWEAACEGRVDDVSQLSTHFTGDAVLMGVALYGACEYSQLNVVTWLVEHTVLRNDRRRLRDALLSACRRGHWNITKLLVNNTQVDFKRVRNRRHSFMLHEVISFTNEILPICGLIDTTEFCRLVYVCDENVNVRCYSNNDTPLHTACFFNDSDRVGALLLAGADETITNDRRETPVQLAVREGEVDVLPLLDVSNEWKLLVRSHHLRRRTAVRVMMTLVKWKVIQRKKWANLVINSLCILKSILSDITDEMSLKQIWDVTDTSSELWTFECLGEKRNQAEAVRNWLTVMFVKLLYTRCTVMTLVREKN
jgi:hypothetical protein